MIREMQSRAEQSREEKSRAEQFLNCCGLVISDE